MAVLRALEGELIIGFGADIVACGVFASGNLIGDTVDGLVLTALTASKAFLALRPVLAAARSCMRPSLVLLQTASFIGFVSLKAAITPHFAPTGYRLCHRQQQSTGPVEDQAVAMFVHENPR